MSEFTILVKIGEGQFGIVFKCVDRKSNQIVAVKQSKEKFEGAKDRLAKLDEVNKVLKLT